MRGMTKAGAWFAGGLGVLLMSGMAWSVLQRSPGVDAEAAPVPTAPQRAAATAPAVTALPMSAASLARMAEQANAELAQLNIAAQAGDRLAQRTLAIAFPCVVRDHTCCRKDRR